MTAHQQTAPPRPDEDATRARGPLATALALAAALMGCGAEPTVPDRPTWADVEPILRAECNHCHGATAATTASAGGLTFRFDFYDMTPEVCGEAAQALPLATALARGYAQFIKADVTPPDDCDRARMPPAPGAPLAHWQRETLIRWASATDPPKGAPRPDNRRPDIQLSADSAVADKKLSFTAVVDDPDGESVVGILKVGELVLQMDRPGSFAAALDTSAWPDGTYPIRAVLCDGWSNFSYDLGNAQIKHK